MILILTMKSPKIIFSINTGRSGSSYIASLMKGFQGINSYHEPNPSLCGEPMKGYQLGKKDALVSLLQEKIDKINNTLEQGQVYFESNHYFIKGFGWEIMDKFPEEEVGIIILKRNDEEIIKSFYAIGVSVLGNGAVMHLIHPFSVHASQPFSNNPISFKIKLFLMRLCVILYNTPYYLGLQKRKSFKIFKHFQYKYLRWYLEEYEHLKQKFIEKYPDLVYLEIDINKMDQDEIIESIREKFGFGTHNEVPLKKNSAKERLRQ